MYICDSYCLIDKTEIASSGTIDDEINKTIFQINQKYKDEKDRV